MALTFGYEPGMGFVQTDIFQSPEQERYISLVRGCKVLADSGVFSVNDYSVDSPEGRPNEIEVKVFRSEPTLDEIQKIGRQALNSHS